MTERRAAAGGGAGLPDRDALWRRFQEKAELWGATVRHVLGERVAGALLSQAAPTAVFTTEVGRAFPLAAAGGAGGLAQVPVASRTPEHVVGSAVFAVAETGSVAIAMTRADRAACFLAEQLWLLVRRDEVVPSLDTALERCAALARDGWPHVTLMTGPSRTADIERVLTLGVHGPRRLTVLIIGASR